MSARGQHEKQGDAHRRSLAHLLACLCFVGCGVDPIAAIPPRNPDDLDADGIPNAADLCPMMFDPDQHDEDGDGVGDACDDCPSLADPAQADFGETGGGQFGDHIGDACDPRPGRDGDRRAAFDPFTKDTSARWTGVGWGIGADTATTDVPARWVSTQTAQGDGLYAEIVVPTLIWLSGGRVEVIVDGDGETAGVSCAIVKDTDGDGRDEFVATEVGGESISEPLAGEVHGPVRIQIWRTIDIDRNGRVECFLDDHHLDMPVTDAIPAGKYAFASSGALTQVSSFTAYTFPINPCASSAGSVPRCDTQH